MKARWTRRLGRLLGLVTLALTTGAALLWYSQFRWIYEDPQTAPEAPVAIVFGAGLDRWGRPSPVLADRVATAVDLYRLGKVRYLLLSGDNRFPWHNEPGAMAAYARQLGVPAEVIQPDYAGRRTYDTCYRARAIFGVRKALLVTQRYHLPRAVFTCRALGIEAYGVVADRRTYPLGAYTVWQLREAAAWVRALLDVWVLRPTPVLGPPIRLGQPR